MMFVIITLYEFSQGQYGINYEHPDDDALICPPTVNIAYNINSMMMMHSTELLGGWSLDTMIKLVSWVTGSDMVNAMLTLGEVR